MTKAREALHLVELEDSANKRPAQLSGGMQQRVALARAIVNRPALLLLDEPLGALDLKLRHQMQLELKTIQAEVGLTFLHVTHDQEEAMTMADTVAVMNGGRIEQMGSPQDLYELPRTAFVANFLGQSNLLEGEVRGTEGGLLVVATGAGTLAVPAARAVATSGRVVVGVRPEKLKIRTAEPAHEAGRNILGPGRVVDVSFSGVSTQYLVDVPGAGRVSVFAQNSKGGPRIATGTEVWLTWGVDHGFGLEAHPASDATVTAGADPRLQSAPATAGAVA
jgi:spermidine/putrescine transport system ATP-binding protein